MEAVVGGYYPGTGEAACPLAAIPVRKLTHLWYAFATIVDDGTCELGPDAEADFAVLADLKRSHPRLRTLISIGGWVPTASPTPR